MIGKEQLFNGPRVLDARRACGVHLPGATGCYRLRQFTLSQRQKRQQCAASASQPSEFSQYPQDDEPLTLQTDWRKFRADLIAKEKRQSRESAAQKEATIAPKQTKVRTKRRPNKKATNRGSQDVWAHQISAPETGCLLLSRNSAGDMGLFTDSVILMVRHDNSRGSCGLLLGRKSGAEHTNPLNQVLSMFSKIHTGGPVNKGSILLLHGPPSMTNSEELFKDVYLGGWMDAHQVLVSGATDLPPMTLFCGSCGWGPYQLETEEKMGSWTVVSASGKCIEEILEGELDEIEIRNKIARLADLDDV